ncbi:GTPase [Yersinia frederiksenii]|nr:GTPase [Yersinia frederiksenii]
MKKSEGLQAIEKPLASLPHAIGKHILDHIQKLTHYEPVIGIMGKTGVENRRSAMRFSRVRSRP